VAKLNNVSLQYDAFGRRIQNAAGTSFLYDGANAAQELSGSSVIANILSGGVDEIFTRADSSGAFTPLKDALGSTIALVDSNGNVQTSYTYDPYGGTSVTGTGDGNEFQYTGRENEGNGLYFYRARYYSPPLGRFISEDPLGYSGSGVNVYSYVFDDPVNAVDPLRLDCRTVGPVTWCNDPADASEIFKKAERAHEKRHRDDFWNLNIFRKSCGELEYRGFQAEIPVWKKRIDDLSGRYSPLSPKERLELIEDKTHLSIAQTQTIEFLEKVYCGHDAAWRADQERWNKAIKDMLTLIRSERKPKVCGVSTLSSRAANIGC
jgi:RHS repeat-associated protein